MIAPPFDVGDQGRMAVFQDPAGAFISAWQGTRMGGFQTNGANAYGWAELNARGVDKALAVLHEGVRLDDEDKPDGRGPARVQRVPARRRRVSCFAADGLDEVYGTLQIQAGRRGRIRGPVISAVVANLILDVLTGAPRCGPASVVAFAGRQPSEA